MSTNLTADASTTLNGTMTPDMAALKTRLKATWMSGDYGYFATFLEAGALEFLAGIGVAPGSRVLDVACGAGQISFAMSRAGAHVTGIDIATNLIEQARHRSQMELAAVHFEEGDAEQLAFPDNSFDLVVSLIGAMFAPRPERVAAEVLRVCRPGGRIVMANWTPQGMVGHLFKTLGKHVPPSPLMPSPMLWGDETTVRERLQGVTSQLRLTKRLYPFRYPFSPAEVVDHYRDYYGPVNRAFAGLDAAGQEALHRDLTDLWAAHNTATDGTTFYLAEYLQVEAIC